MEPKRPDLRAGLSGWLFVGVLGALVLLLAVAKRGPAKATATDARVFINEFQALNDSSFRDKDGNLSGWMEVFNAGPTEVHLDGWHLTDSYRNLKKWRFPAVTLGPQAFVVVFASGKDRRDPAGELHTNFKLNDRGEYLALVKPDGATIAHHYAPRFPRQREGLSYGLAQRFHASGRHKVRLKDQAFFHAATPGAPNADGLAGLVADTKFSRDRGFYSGPFTVRIATHTPGARIFYTTNGAPPSEATSKLYRTPLRISRTTVLRAAAFKPGYGPSDVDTHTYIFVKDVVRQTGAGFPPHWGLTNGQPVLADYTMDPEIVTHSAYEKTFLEGLKAIPTLSVVTDLGNLFDPETGIYANPREKGGQWERPASVELIYPDGERGFQVDCGLRIQGGWNRRPEECPKHSLRLVFKKEYGAAPLRFPLFGPEGVADFQTLTVRGGCNNTWLHWSGEERRRGDYLRDQWMRDTMGAMGHLSARGLFVHVYLNGLYWGLYNFCERPSAPWLAANFGGVPEDYDSRNAGKVLSGDNNSWSELLKLANAGLSSDAAYQEIQRSLDLTNFIDYMILNFYGANADWDRASNWYAGRKRDKDGKFQFFVWDGERTLEGINDNTIDFDDDLSPSRLFHKLEANAEFRLLFAGRVQHHFANGGALSPRTAATRFRARALEIEKAIVAESARWGDYRRDFHRYKTGPYELYTADDHWRPEIRRLLTEYFPQRTGVVLEQFRARGLYPKTDPPTGVRTNGRVTLGASADAVFYTLNGSDPRLPGGRPSPWALKYEQAIVPPPASGTIKARALRGTSETGEWSALAEF